MPRNPRQPHPGRGIASATRLERHHNQHRPHQGLGNKIPIEYEYPDKPAPPDKVKCDSALGGLLNHYYVDTDHGCSGKAA
jgi:hypothetical protein